MKHKEAFKIGDMVKLIGSEPKMTVMRITDGNIIAIWIEPAQCNNCQQILAPVECFDLIERK